MEMEMEEGRGMVCSWNSFAFREVGTLVIHIATPCGGTEYEDFGGTVTRAELFTHTFIHHYFLERYRNPFLSNFLCLFQTDLFFTIS